ncbi:MAG: translation elongation factor Ts [Candidatus Cloacimonadota bacterium]|nr:translation elongation factor Ts [Candidatus Cloacimonadota bacterium]
MKISAKTVMELRSQTNAGMMDCKKALQKTNGNMEAAIEYLREKGISKAAKKADRVAAEGLILAAISNDHKKGALLEFNSETDFVAKNENFIKFGEKMTELVLNNDIADIQELLKTEVDGMNVKDALTNMIAKIGENLNLRRFAKIVTDGFVTSYIHMGGNIGVLVELNGEYNSENEDKAYDVAMHIAAMAPDYLDKSEVPAEVEEKESEIIRKQLLDQGKPEKIIDKIVMGKMNKFYEENCLLQQKFVKDDKISVSQYIAPLIVKSFIRFKIGEGVEKENTDFASEVAEQIKG